MKREVVTAIKCTGANTIGVTGLYLKLLDSNMRSKILDMPTYILVCSSLNASLTLILRSGLIVKHEY